MDFLENHWICGY